MTQHYHGNHECTDTSDWLLGANENNSTLCQLVQAGI